MDIIETVEMDGFTINICPDEFQESPREWGQFGTMVCWHRRYKLGDEQPTCSPKEWMRDFVCSETGDDHDNPESAFEEMVISLPLYLFDHSGITISTQPFSCPWDSGQVGFIYVPIKKVLKELEWRKMTAERRIEIEGVLRNEVKTYDQFLRGEVYGFQITGPDGEEVDAIWGFFGYDHEESGLLPSARECVEFWKKNLQCEESRFNASMAL